MDLTKLSAFTFQIRYDNLINIEEIIKNIYESVKDFGYVFPINTNFNMPKEIIKNDDFLKNQPVFIINHKDKDRFILVGYFFISLVFNKLSEYKIFEEELKKIKIDNYVKDNKIIRIRQQINMFYENENIFNKINFSINNDKKGNEETSINFVEEDKKTHIKKRVMLTNKQKIKNINTGDTKEGSSFNIDSFIENKNIGDSVEKISKNLYNFTEKSFNGILVC